MSVYFVRCTATDAVKIGYADDPFRRFSKIQSDSPGQLELIGVEDGDRAREAQLHAQFASLRRRGEWFEYGQAIRAHVAALPPSGVRTIRRKLAGKLGQWLYDHDINTLAFAGQIGCCWSSVSHFCNGKRIPSYELMRRIYSATNGAVQPNDFYDLPALADAELAA